MTSTTADEVSKDPEPAVIPVQLTHGLPTPPQKYCRPNHRVRRRRLRQLTQLHITDNVAAPERPPSPSTAPTTQLTSSKFCCSVAAINSCFPDLAQIQCDCNDHCDYTIMSTMGQTACEQPHLQAVVTPRSTDIDNSFENHPTQPDTASTLNMQTPSLGCHRRRRRHHRSHEARQRRNRIRRQRRRERDAPLSGSTADFDKEARIRRIAA